MALQDLQSHLQRRSLFGFAFLFFSQVGRSTQALALGISKPKAVVHCLSPCLWLMAEFIFLLRPRPQTGAAFLLNWGGMNRPDGARVWSQCYWVLFQAVEGILSSAEAPNLPSARSGKYMLPSGLCGVPSQARCFQETARISEGLCEGGQKSSSL